MHAGMSCKQQAPAWRMLKLPPILPHSRFMECLWGSERKAAQVDTQGLEDPKLFVWPGKGVYAVFGRKPEALGASPYCRDPIFVQFMVQVHGRAVQARIAQHISGRLPAGMARWRCSGKHGPVSNAMHQSIV